MKRSNRLFLLGAGASVDSRLPTSVMLTDIILKEVKQRTHNYKVDNRTIDLIMSGLQLRRANNQKIKHPINFEEIIEACRLIYNRNESEISSFVHLWNPLIDKIESKMHMDKEEKYKQIICEKINYLLKNIGKSYDRGNRSISTGEFISRPNINLEPNHDHSAFPSLESSIISIISEKLGKIAGKPQKHLRTFVTQIEKERDIICSLNYDFLIEKACFDSNINISDGLRIYRDGTLNTEKLYWSKNDLHIVKPHGSLLWDGSIKNNKIQIQKSYSYEEYIDRTKAGQKKPIFQPIIVAGIRNKFQYQKPFFDFYVKIQNHIDSCKEIFCIGYSFNDDHINKMILSSGKIINVINGKNQDYNNENIGNNLNMGFKEWIETKFN
jgi:hypothetical protein